MAPREDERVAQDAPVPRTVFFLSDYGSTDEFVGVVHAVLVAGAPYVRVIDLTHQIPAFDVGAGSRALLRAAPYLGGGVVLAVVDPGVGSDRRGLCVPVTAAGRGMFYFVGPDNGLLVDAAEFVGGAPIDRAFALHRPARRDARGSTFDGRDLFAPVASALCRGVAPEEFGDPVEPRSLVRLPAGALQRGRLGDGRHFVRAEIGWVDHFGNVQLTATAAHAERAGVPSGGPIEVRAAPRNAQPKPPTMVRRVQTFADLGRGELGLLVDANGYLALVAGEASAAHVLEMSPGEEVVLTW